MEVSSLSVTTWPMPIITYQDTTSTPSGGNFCQKPVSSSFRLISARFMLCRCLRKMVSSICPEAVSSAIEVSSCPQAAGPVGEREQQLRDQLAGGLVGQAALRIELLRGLADHHA